MAFSFGGASSSGGLFGSSTPAFGAGSSAFTSATPAFGSSQPQSNLFGGAFGQGTPAFGASAPAFGASASSAPAFGASLFQGSTSSFVSITSPSLCPKLLHGKFKMLHEMDVPGIEALLAVQPCCCTGCPYSAKDAVLTMLAKGEVGSTQGGGGSSWASQPASSPGLGLALAPFGQQQQQQQQQQQASQYHTLVTKDNKPVVRSTAWDEMQPQGQNYLLEIECVLLTASHLLL